MKGNVPIVTAPRTKSNFSCKAARVTETFLATKFCLASHDSKNELIERIKTTLPCQE
jgi:hypothetical protein